MLTYQQKQDQLIKDLEQRFRKGESPSTIVSKFDDYKNNNQICLTSVVFMPPKIQASIFNKIINPLKQVDNNQYYYLPESLHLTIKNIRTIADPILFNDQDIQKVKVVFKQVVSKFKFFSFELKNLCQLPASIFLAGYCGPDLKYLLKQLDQGLIKAGVPDNKKYISDEIFFGNISLCRYLKKPNQDFINKIKELKDIKVGQLPVKTISLVTTNCVCHPSKTKIIEEYKLST